MLKEGWVTAAWRESANGRRIRLYRITAAGARHLDDQVSHFERMLEGIRLVLAPVSTMKWRARPMSADRDLDEEIEQHLEEKVEELVAQGVPAGEALRGPVATSATSRF